MKKTLPLNPNTEILRWGPIPGRFYYISDFNEGVFNYFPKSFPGFRWPKTLLLCRGGKILWLNEYPELRKEGQKVFQHFILQVKEKNRLYKKWKNVKARLARFENKISKVDFKKFPDSKMRELGNSFHCLLMDFWLSVTPPELGNYGSDFWLDNLLKKYIKNGQERRLAMEALTAPVKPSFYQQEEMDLITTKDIDKHQKQYFWLKNSYAGTLILDKKYFQDKKKSFAKNHYQQLTQRIKNIKIRKTQIIKSYSLPADIVAIASALSFSVFWQDERKAEIFKYLHFKDKFLRELSRRKNIPFSELLNLATNELAEAYTLPSEQIKRLLKNRASTFGFYCEPGKIKEFGTSDTLRYWKLYGEEKTKGNVLEFKGKTASLGKNPIIKAKVCIIFDPKNSKNFKPGNILVAPMTSPDFVFIMKKAGAIITDSGGLTSHAAIVSRELNIPCIVDTKLATKVLKDGDLVEVNANTGTIRLLKK